MVKKRVLMKTTDIVTAHNVVIEYELAPVALRGLASLLDIVIVFFYLMLISILFSMFSTFDIGDSLTSFEVMYLIYFLFLIPMFFYSFIMEALFGGQTVGKMALGIRVLKIDGSNPTMGDLFLRWTFRIVDLWMSLGGLALLVASATDKSQRLGDVVSNTNIIKLQPTTRYSIKDILTIKSKKDYEPQYPQVTRLTDDDMLLIKNAIDRFRKYPTPAYKKLLLQLAKDAAEQLSIGEIPKNKVTFLRTLLQDYIVLTRS